MFKRTYKTFGTVTNPATETESIGLLAFAPLSWFLHRHLNSFFVTRHLLHIYRDFATLTVSLGRETSRPFTGTLQKLMPTLTQTATPHTTGPSDCLITKMKSLRIEYLKFFVYRYPNRKVYKIGY
jgi:hypothetical protein